MVRLSCLSLRFSCFLQRSPSSFHGRTALEAKTQAPDVLAATGASLLSLISADRAWKFMYVPSAADTNTPVTIPASVSLYLHHANLSPFLCL